MTTTVPTKTASVSVVALQSVAASTVLKSSEVDVSTKHEATFYVRFGRRAVTAAGAGANIRIESSAETSGDGKWNPDTIITTNFAAVEGEAVNGTCASGQAVVPVASTTNLTAGDVIFIDNPTIGNSEWGRIKSISANVSVTLEDNLINAQTGSTLYDAAEIYPPITIPLQSRVRLRVVDDGSLFTQAHAIEIDMVTLDSYATT
jgi:hypothetical protein